MNPISQIDAAGKEWTGDELEARNKQIKSEIAQILGKYDLTMGQAIDFLSECQHDLNWAAFSCPLSEALPRLTHVQQKTTKHNTMLYRR